MQEERTYFEANLPDYFMAPKRNKDLATASLVIGIICCFTLSLAGIGTILGVVLGVMALRKAKNNPARYGGEGLAKTGIGLSLFAFVMTIGLSVLVYIIVPRLYYASRSDIGGERPLSNDDLALSNMRFIESSERTYHDYITPGSYATLQELRTKNLVTYPDISHGFRFRIELKNDGFEAFATPEKYPDSGKLSYWVTRDSAVVSIDNHGQDVPPENRHRVIYEGYGIGPGKR